MFVKTLMLTSNNMCCQSRFVTKTKNKIRRFYKIKNLLTQRLKHVNVQQTKYYNRKHKFVIFAINNLIMLFIKNLKQKRFNKKLSHKFAKSFKIKNKIDSQTYKLNLFNIYWIYNTFHVLLLKKYHYRVDDKKTKTMF